jgi:glycosyltransferase involved in cell wall biosynthesis
VTVSIPYFRCKPYIRRSVESILGQTHTNLVAVVVNDGDEDAPWDELAHITDPRLVRFDLTENRGRYFADAVVLNATPDSYFLIQDADDWSEPDRISVLLRRLKEDQADGVVSSLCRYRADNGRMIAERKENYAALHRPLTETLRHRASHAGLFKSESLKRIGGYYGGFRIGYDTQIMSLLLMVGRISYVDRPLYNRLIRPDSLTRSQTTGLQSPARDRVHQQLQEIYGEVYEHYTQYLKGEIGKEALCGFICQICSRRLSRDAHTELMQASDRLRAVLHSGCEGGRHRPEARGVRMAALGDES